MDVDWENCSLKSKAQNVCCPTIQACQGHNYHHGHCNKKWKLVSGNVYI